MDTILVFDIGPSRCRVSHVAVDGTVVASAEGTYLTGVIADWVEQEPRDWWWYLRLALKELKEKQLDANPVAVALTGQVGILILADDVDRLDAALMPNDRRATMFWRHMVDTVGLDTILRSANNVHEDTSHIAKLLWLRQHQSLNLSKTQTIFLGAHDYIAWRLCGARVTDYTTASATDLFSLHTNTWAIDLLKEFNLPVELLPELVIAGARVGAVSADAASQLDLAVGLPVYLAGSDVTATLVGAGVRKPNQYACYLGDSGYIAATGLSEMGDPVTGLMNLRDAQKSDCFTVVGPMVTAAGNFEWLKDRFGTAEEKVFAEEGLNATQLLTTLAQEAPTGSGGIIYLPHLSGERTPYRDPNARGAWLFIHRKSWRSDFYRAVLEGVAYSLRAAQLLMPETTLETPTELRLIGGDSVSAFWAQIFADVFDCRVDLLSPADDVAARGAAFLAAVSLKWYQGDTPPYEYLHSLGTFMPDPERVRIYERLFQVFVKIYPTMQPLFEEMAKRD